MKTLLILITTPLLVLFISAIAFAQAGPSVPDSIQFITENWKTYGWLGGIAGVLNVAVVLFRAVPQGKALWEKLPKLGRLAIVFVLAAAAAGIFAGLSGVGVPAAIGAGVMAGLAAIGSNQVGKALKPKESKTAADPTPGPEFP